MHRPEEDPTYWDEEDEDARRGPPWFLAVGVFLVFVIVTVGAVLLLV